jgi:hypothetical protein
MKFFTRVFSLALTLSLGSAIYAQKPDTPVDLVGAWKVTASSDEGSRELTWTFSNDGDKLSGDSLDNGNSERRALDRITVKGKEVKLEVDINQDGNQGTIVVEAEEESPGKLLGKWAIVGTDGTEYMSGKVSAVKEVQFEGEWVATATLPDGQTMESNMKLAGPNSALKGSVNGRAGEVELDKLTAKDRQLELAFDFEMDGNTIDCTIKAEAKDTTNLVGKWSVVGEDGAEMASGKWMAVRKAAGLAGVWDVVASVPDGADYNGTLTLTETNGKYAGETKSSGGEARSLSSAEINGESVKLTVPFEYQGITGTITINAKQTPEGSLKGEWVLTGNDGNELARETWTAVPRK